MAKLDRVILINSARFDYLEFPVGGHGQVIGINGHGKSTLLRTILFFYLGSNEKPFYALHENKLDFVSYYLGDPPAYLIYEISRGDNQPPYHIVVTRPSNRIQFLFVDAPYAKDYYVRGNFVQPLENVLERLREARCSYDSVTAYEDFQRRVYGLVGSPYAVFRPIRGASSQVFILPRIISGIFTVNQLDADKLKAALTCGVREDAMGAELDLVALKGQLENFRRVHRAVDTFLRHEKESDALLTVAENFESAKNERKKAIDELVRMGKRLPARRQELADLQNALDGEKKEAVAGFEEQKAELEKAIKDSGEKLAVLIADIERGEQTEREYKSLQIDKKAADLERLPQVRHAYNSAEEQYKALTEKFDDENQRKAQMLANVQRAWSQQCLQFEQRRGEAERALTLAVEKLGAERKEVLSALDEEYQRSLAPLKATQAGLAYSRTKLTDEYKSLADIQDPPELRRLGQSLEETRRKQHAEGLRLQKLRSDQVFQKAQNEREREKINEKAQAERQQWEAKIAAGKARRDVAADELMKFDQSLANFFQLKSPGTWADAAKTLSRDALFHDAKELQARAAEEGSKSVWGVEISTEKLPLTADGLSRKELDAAFKGLQKAVADDHAQMDAAHQRYLASVDESEKKASAANSTLQNDIGNCDQLCRSLASQAEDLENRLITLQAQVEAHRKELRSKLDSRDKELRGTEAQYRADLKNLEGGFQSRREKLDSEFSDRQDQLTTGRDQVLSKINAEENESKTKVETDTKEIEAQFQAALAAKGANPKVIAKARSDADSLKKEVVRIEGYQEEVHRFQGLKQQLIEPLPTWRLRRETLSGALANENHRLAAAQKAHETALSGFEKRGADLARHQNDLKADEDAVARFRQDVRFMLEWALFELAELEASPFYRAGVARESLTVAEAAHQRQVDIDSQGSKAAKSYLNKFDAETLEKKVLGFSPIHDQFNWYFFVGAELRPFVNGRGIDGMRQIQTQEFDQLIRNISSKNAEFLEGIRQVRQTATLVEANLKKNNFVDVLDSIELRVDRVDSRLTETLAEVESFAGLTFGPGADLWQERANKAQIDKAIETFARLVREIENHRDKQLRLTDYFDFQIRVQENGRDLQWRRSLDHIGSTGTDYLVKMLIYLSLIEVYRERAVDAKASSTVHCVLDETGVLAPKYVRRILEYAKERGIVLITAGHSQQTVGFENWLRVRKQGARFAGQLVLRKVLKCDVSN